MAYNNMTSDAVNSIKWNVSYHSLVLLLCMLCCVYSVFIPATLTEVFLCFFLSCKANARVYLAKTGHGLHSSLLMNCVVLCIVFVDFVVLYL